MHPGKIPAFFGFGFICMLVSGSIISTKPLRAQNQQTQNAAPSGISVPVKMIDPVDSQTDPAGKQYRASVAKAVNAGSGVQIPQGTPATVVLAQGANGWSTQLTSLTVEGQAIAVTSSSASVTSAAQSAAASAANAVGSVFGGFGHHAPPAAVTAVAVGQRVVLPPGVTLTFVVATPWRFGRRCTGGRRGTGGKSCTGSHSGSRGSTGTHSRCQSRARSRARRGSCGKRALRVLFHRPSRKPAHQCLHKRD